MQYVLILLLVLGLGFPALDLPSTFTRLLLRPFPEDPRSLWLAGGLVAGVLTGVAVRRSPRTRFLATLQHELSHLAMALALGTSPRSLSAGEGAGLFQYELRGPLPRVRAFLITLAPYWFSPLLIAPWTVALLAPMSRGWRLGVLAWLLAICLTLPLLEIHPRQSDLRRYHVVPPLLAALWLWAGMATLSLAVVVSGSFASLGDVYRRSWDLVSAFFG